MIGRKRCVGREKIIALLSEDGALTMAALARRIGITPKAVGIRQCGSLGGKVQ